MFGIGQSNFLQALGWAVLNSLWQMAFLWVVYQLITATFKRTGASRKSLLATILLFTGFAWFLVTFIITLGDANAAREGYSAFVTVQGSDTLRKALYTFLPISSIVYLLLLVIPVLNFIRNYRYVQVIRNNGLIKANVKWRMFVQNVSGHMGIKKPVHFWLSEFVTSPVTIGFLKPIILLPVAAINHLSADQVEAILLHELSHIRRFDFLLNLISKAIKTVLYFNPFVKAFAKIIETEREKNCDEIVLQFQYEPHRYASALLTLEKAAHPIHTLAVAASTGKKHELLRRVESILGIGNKQPFSFYKLAGVLAALLCFLGINAIILFGKPGETKLQPGLLTDLSVPFHLFTPAVNNASNNHAEDVKIIAEMDAESIVNRPAATTPEAAEHKPTKKQDTGSITDQEISGQSFPAAPGWTFQYVNAAEKIIPELAPEEEKQVQEALKASQKVMTEDHWKLVEQNIADVMTLHEKEKLKDEYEKEMNKMDWEKVEEQLKLAYEKINWNQMNLRLNKALTEIKLDSVQQVYSLAIAELSSLEKELREAKQPGIPDTDITLKTLNQQKKDALKVINMIKSIRERKIIHL